MTKTRRRASLTANSEEGFQNQLDPEPNSNTRIPKTPFTKLSSLSLKSVLLYDWWLIRAEDKGLAVGGVASRWSLGVRAFCSTAITKRHDTTTLETEDGITITISGFINRSRTHLNGFPLQVCNHFLLGFPYYWEEYANQFCGQEYPNGGVPSRGSYFDDVNMSPSSNTNTLQPVSLDDTPVTKIRDLVMTPGGDSENSVLHKEMLNLLGKCSSSSVQDETQSNDSNSNTSQHSRAVRKTEKNKCSDQTKKCTDIPTPSRGVVTRSMARLRNLANEQEENFSLIKH